VTTIGSIVTAIGGDDRTRPDLGVSQGHAVRGMTQPCHRDQRFGMQQTLESAG
jgi:hypothetical protein